MIWERIHHRRKEEKNKEYNFFNVFISEKIKNIIFYSAILIVCFLMLQDLYTFTFIFGFDIGNFLEYVVFFANSSNIPYFIGISMLAFAFPVFILAIIWLSFSMLNLLNKITYFEKLIYYPLLTIVIALIAMLSMYQSSMGIFLIAIFTLMLFINTLSLFVVQQCRNSIYRLLIFLLLYVFIFYTFYFYNHLIKNFLFFAPIQFALFAISMVFTADKDTMGKKQQVNIPYLEIIVVIIIFSLFYCFYASEEEWKNINSSSFTPNIFLNKRLLVSNDEELDIPIEASQISYIEKQRMDTNISSRLVVIDKDGLKLHIEANSSIKRLPISDAVKLYFSPKNINNSREYEIFIVKNRDLQNSCKKCYELLAYKVKSDMNAGRSN